MGRMWILVAISNGINMNYEHITPKKFPIMGRIMTEAIIVSNYVNAVIFMVRNFKTRDVKPM
jgi:hypothetical protein